MEMCVLYSWLLAFCTTVAIESVVYQCVPFEHWRRRTRLARLKTCMLLNLATHPFIFLVLPQIHTGAYTEYVVMAELIAVFGESHMLRRAGYSHSLAVSCVANLLSWQFGLWVIEQLG